jgi:hypothetical protein
MVEKCHTFNPHKKRKILKELLFEMEIKTMTKYDL